VLLSNCRPRCCDQLRQQCASRSTKGEGHRIIGVGGIGVHLNGGGPGVGGHAGEGGGGLNEGRGSDTSVLLWLYRRKRNAVAPGTKEIAAVI
jgi:hypothetical protein